VGVTAIMAIAAVTTATNALHRTRMMRLASDPVPPTFGGHPAI